LGLLAPTGTASGIINQIALATRVAVADRGFQQLLMESGMEPDLDSTPEKFSRSLEDDISHWRPIAKEIGIKLD
jgi:tripartite-type tricarboxylate transporter receptor subunit TctC